MFRKCSQAMCMALILSIMMSLTVFDAKCTAIRQNVLRLHILAHSDSEFDQTVKQSVRDAIIRQSGDLFDTVTDYDQAVAMAEQKIPLLERTVEEKLVEYGCDYSAKVYLGVTHFDTRTYDDVTLPAGDYMALQVELGDAKGHNWWCVMFPSLCLPAVSQKDEVDKVLDQTSTEIVTNAARYKPAFKVVEWYEKLKTWLQ